MHGSPNAPETGSTADNVPPRGEHLPLGRQQVEEQQVGVAPQSNGLLRRVSVEHHHPRLDAARRILQVPIDGVFLRNLETRVQDEAD